MLRLLRRGITIFIVLSSMIGFVRRSVAFHVGRAVCVPPRFHGNGAPAFVSTRQYASSGINSSKNKESELDPAIRAKDVVVPLENFARSSGPGGQNVNKVNTKAELRLHVQSATWLAAEVRQRIIEYNPNKITNDGELYLSSQEQRTQTKNKDDCVMKLKEIIAEAMMTPKEREIWFGLSDKTKQKRREEKRHRRDIKSTRKKIKDYDML